MLSSSSAKNPSDFPELLNAESAISHSQALRHTQAGPFQDPEVTVFESEYIARLHKYVVGNSVRVKTSRI